MERSKIFALAFCLTYSILISGCVQIDKTFATSPFRENCFVLNNSDIGCIASMKQINDSHVAITLNIADSKNGPRERRVYQTAEDFFAAFELAAEEFDNLSLSPPSLQLSFADTQKIMDYSLNNRLFYGSCDVISGDISRTVVLQCPINPANENMVLVSFRIGKTVDRPVDKNGMPDLNWNPPAEDGPCSEISAYQYECYEQGAYVAVVR